MRKIILIMFLSLSIQMIAQENEMKFGIHAGANRSIVSNTENALGKAGLHAGVSIEYQINNTPFSVRSGINYSEQGFKSDGDVIFEGDILLSSESTIKLDYLQLPLLLQYDFSKSFGIFAGPQLNYNIQAKVDTGAEFIGRFETDIDNANELVVSGAFGLQASLSANLIARLQYDTGLTRTFEKQSMDMNPQNTNDAKNQTFTLVIGYQF